MFAIAKFILPDPRGTPKADNEQEESKGLLATFGRTLVPQWYDLDDDWQRLLVANDKIKAKGENQPYLDLLDGFDGLKHEVESFMLGSHQRSYIRVYHAERVESLIVGDSLNSTTTRPNVPTIWVWDWRCYPERPRSHGALGKQLSLEQLLELLSEEACRSMSFFSRGSLLTRPWCYSGSPRPMEAAILHLLLAECVFL